MRRRMALDRAAFGTLLFAFVACSGGGSGSAPPRAATDGSTDYGKLVLAIPAEDPRDHRDGKHRSFLSPSATSVSIAVNDSRQPVIADISATSSNCTAAAAVRTCAIPIGARAGNDTFVATLYAGANATGAVLGTGTVTQAIANGAPFVLSIDVAGVAATISITATTKQFDAGVPATSVVAIAARDAGGNVISGTYANPIALANSDTTGTFTISPTTITSSTTTVTLSYSGGTAVTTATIAASSANVPASTTSTQVVTVGPPSAPTPTPAPKPPKPTPSPTATPTPPASTQHIYAADLGSSAITLTAIGANGNIAPSRQIVGDATGISQSSQPYDTAVDANGRAYASGLRNATIVYFAATANGDATPAGTITGADTGLSDPLGMAFDAKNELIVSNFGANSITIYAAGADGNAVPARTISGSNTLIAEAYGLTLDTAGNIYLVDDASQFGGTDAVTVYAATASGNVAPTRTISGSNTGFDGAVYDAVDASGNLYVTSVNAGTVGIFGPNANGNVVPDATIGGSLAGFTKPTGIAVDASGNVYVADENSNAIYVFAKGATGNVMPIRTIVGTNTALNVPLGIKIGP